jgi:hypothetical protein
MKLAKIRKKKEREREEFKDVKLFLVFYLEQQKEITIDLILKHKLKHSRALFCKVR